VCRVRQADHDQAPRSARIVVQREMQNEVRAGQMGR
jgi:hypothetical protein